MARITVDELKVIITADVKELDKALSKSGKTVKDYVKELKDTSKSTKEVSEGTDKAGEAFEGLARGILNSTTGMGNLMAGGAAAATVIGVALVGAVSAAMDIFNKYDAAVDKVNNLSVTPGLSEAVVNANKRTIADLEDVVGFMIPISEKLNLSKEDINSDAYLDWSAQVAKVASQTGASADAIGVALSEIYQEWGKLEGYSQIGSLKKYTQFLYEGSQKAGVAIDAYAQSVASSSFLMKQLGYDFAETSTIMFRFFERNVDPGIFISLLNRNSDALGGNAKAARAEMDSLIASTKHYLALGQTGEIHKMFGKMGFSTPQANEFIKAINRGVFDPGQLAGDWGLPTLLPEDLGEWWTLFKKNVETRVFKSVQDFMFYVLYEWPQILAKAFEHEPVEPNFIQEGTKALTDIVKSGEWDAWYFDILTEDERKKLTKGQKVPPTNEQIRQIVRDYMKEHPNYKLQPLAPVKMNLLPSDMVNPQIVAGGLTGGLSKYIVEPETVASMRVPGIDVGMRVASAGYVTDFGGYGVGPSLNEKEQASKDELLISDRTSQALITDSRLVLQHRLEDYGTWRRSSEAAFGAVTSISREAAESSAQSFYTLKTAFGDINFDITKMSKALEEWGIDVPVVIDNIVAGVKRLGKEWLDSMGLEDSYEKLVEWANEAGEIYKEFQTEIGAVWDAVVEKSYLGAEEAAKAIEGFGSEAISKMKELVGTVVTTLSEGFATGKMNWKKLWQETWTSLLNILVEWGVKALLTFAATKQGMLAMEAVAAAILGDWKTAALAAAGIASVVAGIAASIAIIKGIGTLLPDGTEDDEGSGGKDPWWNPDPDAYKPGAQQPGRPEGSGPGASSVEASGRPNVVVHIHNPQYMGQFSDSDAAAFGQAFGEALIVRGVMPQPIG